MVKIYTKRMNIHINPEVKVSEDDQIIIDFVDIYSQILPSIRFYQIKDLPIIQGFDLISYLEIDFRYNLSLNQLYLFKINDINKLYLY